LRREFQSLFSNTSLSGLAFMVCFIDWSRAVPVFVQKPTRTQALPLAEVNSAVGVD
jgi:hypothetical protein